jgi:hypothetical protein
MDNFGPLRPLISRVGNIAAKTAYHHAVGFAGHGVRKIQSGITDYSGPDENSINPGVGGGNGGIFGGMKKIIGGVVKGIDTGMKVGAAVAPLLPAGAALLA